MTYEELQSAIRLLGFEDRVTLQQIKERYRQLARQFHPDHGAQETEQMEQLNTAYAILMSYGDNYRLSFSQEEFFAQNDEARLMQQFGDDPLWGSR